MPNNVDGIIWHTEPGVGGQGKAESWGNRPLRKPVAIEKRNAIHFCNAQTQQVELGAVLLQNRLFMHLNEVKSDGCKTVELEPLWSSAILVKCNLFRTVIKSPLSTQGGKHHATALKSSSRHSYLRCGVLAHGLCACDSSENEA